MRLVEIALRYYHLFNYDFCDVFRFGDVASERGWT